MSPNAQVLPLGSLEPARTSARGSSIRPDPAALQQSRDADLRNAFSALLRGYLRAMERESQERETSDRKGIRG